MELNHIDDLYLGVLVTINIPSKQNKHITKNFSKKLILRRISKDGKTFYESVLNGTYVPAEYETKKLRQGMTYATEIEPLRNYYSESEIIDKNTVKIIEDNINLEIDSKIDNSKKYNTNNLFIGRIYNYTMDKHIRIYSTQNLSREFIFERLEVEGQISYKEIWSNVVYKELVGNVILGEYYVEVKPFNKVFPNYVIVTKNELLGIEQRLSNTNIINHKKILTLKSLSTL